MGYIRRHWRGENSLPFAYWVNGVLLTNLLGIVFGSVLITQEMGLDDTAADDEVAGVLLLFLLIVVILLAEWIWAITGTWKSAANYIASAQAAEPKRSGFWGYAAKISIVLGVIFTIIQIFAGA